MNKGTFIASLIVIGIGVWLFWGSGSLGQTSTGQDPLGPAFYPRLLAGSFIVLGSILLFQQVFKQMNMASQKVEDEEDEPEYMSFKNKMTIISIILLGVVYIFVLDSIGFILATTLYIVALMLILHERTWWKIGLTSVTVSVVLYLLFSGVLNVLLPTLF
ncbi:tripartite tricarboxylate transporter TctB family protein [Alkalibacillus silvisoli]|uniref:DUF1468 domain-containing protein n=1 Tax=Alkalibacillus silvisoli TaxID=392823 RepID=A0ABP3K1S0_9BACI